MTHRPPHGFTLLEILVVISMLAILAVGVGLSLGNRGSAAAEMEAERLRGLLELARDESLNGGRAVLWQPVGKGYRFLQSSINDDTGFAEPALDERLRLREFAEPLDVVSLRIGGQEIQPEAGLSFNAGQTPRFSLELRQGDQHWVINGHAGGRIELNSAGSAP